VTTAHLWNRIIGYAVAIVIAYLLILLLARIFESKLIFFPNYPGRLTGDWQPRSLPVENISIDTTDGVRLHAWWIPARNAAVTFLAFHGNAANITNRSELYRFLWDLPANVLALEYRGYGRSTGAPSEAGIYRDAEAAYDYLVKTRNIAPEEIVSFGQSLGTAVAVDLATKRNVRAIILEAPFASTKAVARQLLPYVPGLGLLAKSKFETARKLGEVSAPVLIVYCTNDPVLPSPLSENVFRAAREPKSFLQIHGMCHEEACLVAPEQYRLKLIEFLNLY
jgi:fermentation-respiration switch protein FrsA (DUF1100 family)